MYNLEREFVPFIQSNELKGLGFNEPCFATYVGETLDLNLQLPSDSYFTVAPLYQQAFRWFRSKGFIIDITTHDHDIYEFYIKWSPDKSILSDYFDTYEEAELECIKKLIEIAKNK